MLCSVEKKTEHQPPSLLVRVRADISLGKAGADENRALLSGQKSPSLNYES